ncbi:ABC transporter I member 6, chloroplastic [Coccomyxa viridis]|uniref:ABC transporter I member 6, chloroplastic n=1 Tax=Coccomyxa viridis TaxID=1274662 RepID=A0AAV1IF14_9CHLO|nr:ABC transporter I member 6, chloroplastic [Coccomyxa viridis]
MYTSSLHSRHCHIQRGAPFWRPLGIRQKHTRWCKMQRFDTVRVFAGEVLLEVKDLEAKVAETGQMILRGVNLTVREGETHAIMGTNGSGKSTLSKCLVGHPDYEVTSGTVTYKGQNLLDLEPEERARAGLFMSFQSPVEVPGVSNSDFLRLAANARRKQLGQEELGPLEFYGYVMPKLAALKMNPDFLNRDVNANFSGGEKKRNEILQLSVLEADIAVLDEIDSGLDIDALRDVADAVNSLKRPNSATLMVTHYKRLLNYVVPEAVHIMEAGKIIYSGGIEVADILEQDGYEGIKSRMREEASKQPVSA